MHIAPPCTHEGGNGRAILQEVCDKAEDTGEGTASDGCAAGGTLVDGAGRRGRRGVAGRQGGLVAVTGGHTSAGGHGRSAVGRSLDGEQSISLDGVLGLDGGLDRLLGLDGSIGGVAVVMSVIVLD